MKRCGFDALTYHHRKKLISAGGLKRHTTPHCFIYCVVCNYFMFRLFKEKTITLANGQKVKEGDKVHFINSDGVKCEGVIKRRLFDCTHSDTKEKLKKGTLYFWNNTFMPSDYKSLVVS